MTPPTTCPDCGSPVEYRSGVVQLNTPSAHDPMQPAERVEWFYGCVDCEWTQEIEGSDRGDET